MVISGDSTIHIVMLGGFQLSNWSNISCLMLFSVICWALHKALFSIMGAIFYYHAPISFLAVSPESPASPLGGGLQVAVQLDYESAGGLFGPTFDPEQTTVPAGRGLHSSTFHRAVPSQ